MIKTAAQEAWVKFAEEKEKKKGLRVGGALGAGAGMGAGLGLHKLIQPSVAGGLKKAIESERQARKALDYAERSLEAGGPKNWQAKNWRGKWKTVPGEDVARKWMRSAGKNLSKSWRKQDLMKALGKKAPFLAGGAALGALAGSNLLDG